jgi:hypothetical protein
MAELSARLFDAAREAKALEDANGFDWRSVQINTHTKLSELREAILGVGPMCRDCADSNGRCPNSGQLCDPQAAALERVAAWKSTTNVKETSE